MKIIIATNNKGKLNEYMRVLQPLGFDVISLNEAGIDIEVEESGATFEENAALKARVIYELYELAAARLKSDFAVIADDSGLEVDALGGAPGVYSARYAPVGQRRATLLAKLEGVPAEKRTARFVCCICYKNKAGEKFVRGECAGFIGFGNRGENGFGYDPIFMYGDKSFAELTDGEKDCVSHRGKALRRLVEELNGAN